MKKVKLFICLFTVVIFLAGCCSTKSNIKKEDKKVSIEEKVKEKMKNMTLEQKIAQM